MASRRGKLRHSSPSTSSGREIPRAVRYAQQAGNNAARRNAPHDAIATVTKGLTLLATLPDSPERTQHELRCCSAWGSYCWQRRGWGSGSG